MNHLIDRLQPFIVTQYGLLTLDQLRVSGLTDNQIRTLVKQGWLERLHRGIFRVAGSPETFEQRLLAACFINGRESTVTHRAACYLDNVDLGREPVVELSVHRTSSARTPEAVIHRPWKLDNRFRREHGVFIATTPARTVVDLGAVVDIDVVAKAAEQVIRRRLASTSYLRHLCAELEHPRRKGPRVLLEVLSNRIVGDTPSDSELELEMAKVLSESDLPMPVFQYQLVIDGKPKRIDFAFPDIKVAFEVDGWEEHAKYSNFQGDRVRRNELELRGWMVLHVTWAQIMFDPDYVIRVVARALELRGIPLGASTAL